MTISSSSVTARSSASARAGEGSACPSSISPIVKMNWRTASRTSSRWPGFPSARWRMGTSDSLVQLEEFGLALGVQHCVLPSTLLDDATRSLGGQDQLVGPRFLGLGILLGRDVWPESLPVLPLPRQVRGGAISTGSIRGAFRQLPSVVSWRREAGHHSATPVWAHRDGAILQVYGAFDALACSIAHQFKTPGSKRAAFSRHLASQLPAGTTAIKDSILTVVASTEWGELDELRNEAAHRGVIVRYFTSSADGTKIHVDPAGTAERREAFSLVHRLVNWAEGPLRWFWLGAEDWREPWEPSVIGSVLDLDA
jgi:hypothetical protein